GIVCPPSRATASGRRMRGASSVPVPDCSTGSRSSLDSSRPDSARRGRCRLTPRPPLLDSRAMKTVGVITIGQSPRDDVVPDMEKPLGPDFRIVQAGALDGLGHAEIAALAPTGDEFPLITRLRDGTSVVIGKERIIGRVQACLDDLGREASAFAIMCTGKFPP